ETPPHVTVDADISAAGDDSAGSAPESPALEREPVEEELIETMIVEQVIMTDRSAGDAREGHVEPGVPCDPNRGTFLTPTASAARPAAQPASPLPAGRQR